MADVPRRQHRPPRRGAAYRPHQPAGRVLGHRAEPAGRCQPRRTARLDRPATGHDRVAGRAGHRTSPALPARPARLERARAAYDVERALEDPFVLAELRTGGEAFAGEVVSAEPSRTIITAAGRPVLRPRFTVRTGDPVRLEPGRVLICPAHHRQRIQIAALTRTVTDAD